MIHADVSKLVSVIMPYRDASDTIGEAISSVLAQRDVELELIAVDDGSRDSGPAIVTAYAAEDARVRALRVDRAGLVAALEHGRRAARGTFIARMDADDSALPTRLREQRDAMERDRTIGVLGTRVELFGDEVGEGMRRYVEWQNALVTPEDHARDLFVESPICHPSAMMRRSLLDAIGGYRDAGWAEDYDLWLRVDAAGHRIAKLPRALVRWRHRKESTTFRSPRYAASAMRAAKAAFVAPKLAALGRPLAIWGAGPTGRRLMRALEEHGLRASIFIDIDPKKIGGTARGAPIVSPDRLERGTHTLLVAVGARGARELVRAELSSRGFVEGTDFICAA